MCQKVLAEMHQHGSDTAHLQLGDFEATFQRFVRELSLDDVEQLENKMSKQQNGLREIEGFSNRELAEKLKADKFKSDQLSLTNVLVLLQKFEPGIEVRT